MFKRKHIVKIVLKSGTIIKLKCSDFSSETGVKGNINSYDFTDVSGLYYLNPNDISAVLYKRYYLINGII